MASTDSSVNAPLATSWWARAVLVGGLVAFVLLALGATGTRLTIWPFTVGLLMFVGGFLLAAIGALTGVFALINARKAERRADRMTAMFGTMLCGAVLGIVLAYTVPAFKVPPIHDITTNLADPPAYSQALLDIRGPTANGLKRDSVLDEKQRAAYPDLHTLDSTLTPAEAFTKALAVMSALQWEVVTSKPEEGRIEATVTSRWFGFKDDVVVRIRAANGAPGSLIDLRSVSRVGQGDSGANAKRIRLFLKNFKAQ